MSGNILLFSSVDLKLKGLGITKQSFNQVTLTQSKDDFVVC